MNIQEKLQEAIQSSSHYPELVKKMIKLGVESYTVDVATSFKIYRFPEGVNYLHQVNSGLRPIAENFNSELTVHVIRENQQGRTNYQEFMEGIAKAGVRIYEATLIGDKKRVTYVGLGGFYEEAIPI